MQTEEAILRKVIVQHILDDKTIITGEELSFSFDEERKVLQDLLLRAFNSCSETYEFSHEIDLDYNVVFDLCRNIYDEADFSEKSKELTQHLLSSSRHPRIKSGDFFVAKFEDLRLGDEYVEGVGLYKFDQKENFLVTNIVENKLMTTFEKGFGTRKPDKACMILFTDEPYTVFTVDNKKDGTVYWQSDFLNIISKNDESNSTSNVIQITKQFIDELKNDPDIDGASRAHILNRSLQYMKDNLDFARTDYEKNVFGSHDVIEKFREFDGNASSRLPFADNFKIVGDIVKKQSRRIRSVLKLDRNFHIYVHGDKDLIERGIEKDGRKYYKLYFEYEE